MWSSSWQGGWWRRRCASDQQRARSRRAEAARGGLVAGDLLASLGLDTRKVAVERNLEIVPRSTYAAVALQEGDRLEIVHFIGGG